VFSKAVDGENQAVGHAAYLTQGDILQSLAPILQVRSDYFRIRTCGQAFAADGTTVLATAYCEAFVQRMPDYSDSTNPPESAVADLSTINRTFGRRFQLVSFRWLSSGEI
jgi:7-keto-8-aminopelargonate synthetase-like enzyme